MKLVRTQDQYEYERETYVLAFEPTNDYHNLIALCVKHESYHKYKDSKAEPKEHLFNMPWIYHTTQITKVKFGEDKGDTIKLWIFQRENEKESDILVLREYARVNLDTEKTTYWSSDK